MSTDAGSKWDAFISYASEDRAAVAEPLAAALSQTGLRIWYDKSELKVGDSLRGRIDDGLANSRFGIVILSQAFFNKHYPVRELNGLAQREIDGEKVILPVWRDVSDTEVRRFSPPLADRVAARWEEGLESVIDQLFSVVGRRIIEETQAALSKVTELRVPKTGLELIGIIDGVHGHVFIHDDFESAEEAQIVAGFLEGLNDTIDGLELVGPAERARLAFEYSGELKALQEAGWKVFSARVHEETLEGVGGGWDLACVAVMRAKRRYVARFDGQFFVANEKDEDAAV